jgi:hypothetical protein
MLHGNDFLCATGAFTIPERVPPLIKPDVVDGE